MARVLQFLALALILALCAAINFVAAAEGDEPAEGDEADIPIENENYERDLATLKDLCKLIKTEMQEVFHAKHHLQAEAGLMSNAADLGAHLDERHREWKTEHHKEWSCKQAREVMAHEKAKKFVDDFESWYTGKDAEPSIPHERAVKLVTRLHDDLDQIRLVNAETKAELNDIIADMEQLKVWHLDMRKAYDALNADQADQACERHFMDFAEVLHQLHSGHVPEWHHVSEGTRLLLEQCQEDPTINVDL